ncbi:NAD-binding protein [Nocardia arizonensis]|uniref:NAD-binding protein n=1 Tax=Nocardia arizonensis TaxID=1141647 RepID=UPI0006D19524|nr:NAD-binding protein [Nocardia arizonensis]
MTTTAHTTRPVGPGAPARFARSVTRVLIDFRWYILAFAAVVAFGLGCVGFVEHLADPTPTDVVFHSLKLFFFTAPDATRLPPTLDVARFLAPVVASFAGLSALAALFRDRVLQMRIPLMHGHVVVCGVGYVGAEFLRHLQKAHVAAVVIESDRTNPHIELCRRLRIPVIVGDAQLNRNLRAAGVRRADRLLAVSPNDAVNTEIVAVARRAASGRPGGELRCLARIGDPQLCGMLRVQEANLADASAPLDFFNLDEVGARLLLDDFPIDEVGPHRPHLLISVLDATGGWLLVHAARDWHDRCRKRGLNPAITPLWVTLLDAHAEQRLGSLVGQYPALAQVCRFICAAPSVSDVRDLAARYAQDGAPPLTRCYVTAYCDEDALEAALMLRHEIDPTVPVVVVLSRRQGVSRLIEEVNTGNAPMRLDVFPTLQRTCTTELLQSGSFHAIAVAIHRRWRDAQLAAGKPAPSWDELDESRKQSSCAQARDIAVKLADIGCAIAPLRDWAAADFTFSDAELERLAVAEHDRWIDERLAEGWRPGPKDPQRKTTPYLVPFADLPPDIAEYDRIFVRDIPVFLAAAGLQVIRLPKT